MSKKPTRLHTVIFVRQIRGGTLAQSHLAMERVRKQQKTHRKILLLERIVGVNAYHSVYLIHSVYRYGVHTYMISDDSRVQRLFDTHVLYAATHP